MNEPQTAESSTQSDHEAKRPTVIRILVNNQPVELHERRVTGLVIKQTAIDQGVRIEIDFVLFMERGNGQRQVIGDNDKVRVHPGSRFEAIPHDDNS